MWHLDVWEFNFLKDEVRKGRSERILEHALREAEKLKAIILMKREFKRNLLLKKRRILIEIITWASTSSTPSSKALVATFLIDVTMLMNQISAISPLHVSFTWNVTGVDWSTFLPPVKPNCLATLLHIGHIFCYGSKWDGIGGMK